MTTSVHPYFIRKAISVLAEAGADISIDIMPLASWARNAHSVCADRSGVLVDDAGRLIAQTRLDRDPVTGEAGGTYLTHALAPEAVGCVGREVGLAREELTRVIGRRMVHVRYSQVAQGGWPVRS